MSSALVLGDGAPMRQILSPSTAARDKVQKRALYANAGIQHYWPVDVDPRTVEVFALEGGRWMLEGSYDDTATVAIPPVRSAGARDRATVLAAPR